MHFLWLELVLKKFLVSLKLIANVSIDSYSVLGHVMAWCRTGDKHHVNQLIDKKFPFPGSVWNSVKKVVGSHVLNLKW